MSYPGISNQQVYKQIWSSNDSQVIFSSWHISHEIILDPHLHWFGYKWNFILRLKEQSKKRKWTPSRTLSNPIPRKLQEKWEGGLQLVCKLNEKKIDCLNKMKRSPILITIITCISCSLEATSFLNQSFSNIPFHRTKCISLNDKLYSQWIYKFHASNTLSINLRKIRGTQ